MVQSMKSLQCHGIFTGVTVPHTLLEHLTVITTKDRRSPWKFIISKEATLYFLNDGDTFIKAAQHTVGQSV